MSVPKVIQDIRDLKSILTALIKYNIMTAVKTTDSSGTITVSPIPQSGWTQVTFQTAYASGEYIISCDAVANSKVPYYAVDNDSSSFWSTTYTATPHWLKIQLPTSIMVTKMKLHMVNSATSTVKIQGSLDDSTWTDLHTFSPSGVFNQEITLTAPGLFKYYRVYSELASSGTSTINDFKLSEYTLATYSMAYSVTGVPTTWVDKQRFLVRTPATDTVGVSENTINGVAVDTILKPSTNYELIYDSTAIKFSVREVA